jgi:outer membrane protein TolC
MQQRLTKRSVSLIPVILVGSGLLSFSFLYFVDIAIAQEPLELTLSQAVEQVRHQNLLIKAENYTVAGALAGVLQERGKFHPRLNFSFTHNAFGDETPSQLDPTREESARSDLSLEMLTHQGTTFEVKLAGEWVKSDLAFLVENPYYQSEAAVTVVRPLMRGAGDGIANTGIDEALNKSRFTKLTFEETVNDAVLNAVSLYWALYFARANLEVAEQSLVLARNTLAEVRDRIQAGKLASIEVFKAEAEVAERQEVIIRTGKELRDSEDRLRGMMNLRDWDREIIPLDVPPDPVTPDPLEEILPVAFMKRTDYRQAFLDQESKVRLKQYYENQNRAKLDLFATVSSTSVDENEKGIPFKAVGLDTASWSAGLNYSKPLGGGEAQGQYMRAQHEEGRARVLLEAITQEVQLSVREAYRALTAAMETIDSTTTTRIAAQKRLQAEEEKFRVGKATLNDVLEFQAEFASALSDEKRSRADYAIAGARLARQLGTLLETFTEN